MMSPAISMESFMDPIQAARPCTNAGGMTSAIGFPNRVTRMGFFVFETCSSSARHLALNSEIATSCMVYPWTTILDHGHDNSQYLTEKGRLAYRPHYNADFNSWHSSTPL